MWCFNVNFFRIPSNSIFIKKTFASNMAIFNTWKIISVSFAASVDKSLTFFGAWVVMKSSTDISAWTSFLKKTEAGSTTVISAKESKCKKMDSNPHPVSSIAASGWPARIFLITLLRKLDWYFSQSSGFG